jgi:hypothetical protein
MGDLNKRFGKGNEKIILSLLILVIFNVFLTKNLEQILIDIQILKEAVRFL